MEMYSFPFPICLCALRHPEEFNRTLILHLIFPPDSSLLSCLSDSIPLHLSSHADSSSHRIPVVVSNQGNHSQRATNRSLIWCLVWSDGDRQPVSSLHLPLSLSLAVFFAWLVAFLSARSYWSERENERWRWIDGEEEEDRNPSFHH